MEMKLNAVGIVVADLKQSVDFYSRLGCEFDGGPIHVEADLGGFRLMLDSESFMRENGLLDEALGVRNSYAFAVQCDSPQSVNVMFDELAAGGAGLTPPFDAPWGQRYATVQDPDGTHVDLYAWLPGQQPGS